MRVAHLADLHIGFRQFDRSTPIGVNQREADVALALQRAVTGVLAAKPDLVLVAGDCFHSVRPTNAAILTMFAELQRLRTTLPATRVVLIAGDHDTPRSSESSSILALYRALGVDVVERQIETLELGDVRLVCVPQAWAQRATGVEPILGRQNVLLIHGEARSFPGQQIDAALLAQPWHYIALGHYHICQQIAERAWYAGSLEYTSTDPWSELRTDRGKGWLLVDLPTGAPTFQPIDAPRRFCDVGPFDCAGKAAAEVDGLIAAALTDIDAAVVRLRLLNVSRETQRSLDHTAIVAAKARALNLQVEYGRPASQAVTVAARGERLKRLDEIVDDFLAVRELPADVDRTELRHLGCEYLEAESAR